LDDYYLYLNSDFKQISVRTGKLSLVASLTIHDITIQDISKYYTFKREGLILFKKDDIYEDTWQETRFLEKGEEGIVVCIHEKFNNSLNQMTCFNNKLYKNNRVSIYKVVESEYTVDFFATKRFYKLDGGLKIGRNTYLQQACPTLKLEHTTKIWFDGELLKTNNEQLEYRFNDLQPGIHYIKLPNFKK